MPPAGQIGRAGARVAVDRNFVLRYAPGMNEGRTQSTLTAADIAQLARFRGVGRVVLHGDDERAVYRLRDAGLLKALRGRWTRYGLTEAGRDALAAAGIDPDEIANLGTAPAHRATLRPDGNRPG